MRDSLPHWYAICDMRCGMRYAICGAICDMRCGMRCGAVHMGWHVSAAYYTYLHEHGQSAHGVEITRVAVFTVRLQVAHQRDLQAGRQAGRGCWVQYAQRQIL